jgi:subtilisin family serine protease
MNSRISKLNISRTTIVTLILKVINRPRKKYIWKLSEVGLKIMNIKVTVFLVLLFTGMIISAPAVTANSDSKKRVIADTTSFLGKIFYRIQGCNVVHELNDATALRCPPVVARIYKLREDRLFHIVDIEADRQVSADQVWSTNGVTGKGVVVAVLDTGVDAGVGFGHPELSSAIIGGQSFVSYTFFYSDDHGHGTHVAGIITAEGVGVNGTARGISPDAEIWAAKVCDSSGLCWESDIAMAIQYVVMNKISRVISLSLGGEGTESSDCDRDYLARKVNWAVQKGVIVVAAAGNSGSTVSSPGCASGAISVGAVDNKDFVTLSSGRGLALDLVAPGANIYSTIPDGGYARWSGTSMAASMVSGTVALLLQKDPSYTVSQVKSSLYRTAEDLGYGSKDQGHGRVDALSAYDFEPSDE